MMGAIKYFIGVDGGGTSCRAVLSRAADDFRIDLRGGSANVSSFDEALASILDTLQGLMARAGVTVQDLQHASIHLGLAGVMTDPQARATEQELGKRVQAARITVSDDQITTLRGALGPGVGAVGAIGTGSFFGRQWAGGKKTLGGWGFQLGDQASGAWLGAELLRHALMAVDGIDESSGLTHDTLAEFGNDPTAIVGFARSAKPAEFAAFAPRVLTAAAAGDAVASRLMQSGARYISRALEAVGWTGSERLCLTGGIGASYAEWLPADVAKGLEAPLGSALDGALAMAAEIKENA